jgi:outer membrane protein assembly factor BamB
MRVDNGAIQWQFHAGGAVKGGLALADGKFYFGTYGGQVYAISQKTGNQVWHTGTSGAHFGLSAGNFYATAAVSFGRVYIGNTDGNMTRSAASGKLAWRRGTGRTCTRRRRSPGCERSADGLLRQLDSTFYAPDAHRQHTLGLSHGGKISAARASSGGIVAYSNWGKRNDRSAR